jgi:hypothetical protein
MTNSTARNFWQGAAECKQAAKQVADPQLRDRCLAIALQWEQLAKQAELADRGFVGHRWHILTSLTRSLGTKTTTM